MYRGLRSVAWLSVAAWVGGCSIAGIWDTVKTSPADARTPFEMVTFNDEGGYTATGQRGSKVVTVTGTYEWNGAELAIHPAQGDTRVYPGRLDMFTKQLVLQHKNNGQKMTAWMQKVE